MKNASKAYNNPSIENMINTAKDIANPILDQRKMQGTYSNPSTAMDL